MSTISEVIFYVLTFLAVYVQVFFFVTFFENNKKIQNRKGSTKLKKYKGVTIIVPAFNEEATLCKTVRSILNLNYQKDKIKIILVNDGSKDNTLKMMNRFAKYPNIRVFNKENGGKHTALNLGLENLETEYVGCLDADSIADPDSLNRIMNVFENDPTIMAVTPSIVVTEPKNLLQHAQRAEYFMMVFIKKMFGFMGGIHVTPGPLTIFNRKVFDNLGHYKEAHKTEDMEIAFRMQKNNYPIEQCNDAYVYTNTPPTVKKLFKQRLRWTYGGINIMLDYKDMLFKKKYGNFSYFTIPTSVISVFSIVFFVLKIIYDFGKFVADQVLQIKTVGFSMSYTLPKIDLFFVDTGTFLFLSILIYIFVIASIMIGYKMVTGRYRITKEFFYYFIFFVTISPFWLSKALYNTLTSRAPDWR
ncbi:MAG: glycosyltransferase family 2 protein [Candidatus Pacebacteria bacterium]|nr:glycosyltransferase family 2 protein [Candidatus Paceibacterota bacterium]MCF7862968.1 glycosyltransferase family 2 protein [Candidatus Paceibacterota bacterium]